MPRSVRVNQTYCRGDRLLPAVHPKLPVDVGRVAFGRLLGDNELARNLFGAEPLDQQLQNLELTPGQGPNGGRAGDETRIKGWS